MQLEQILASIQPSNRAAYDACIARFDHVAKPIGSLGKLEELLAKIAAVYGDVNIDIAQKCALVFCADNGVLAQGVAQCGSEVTTAIAHSLAAGKASVSVMAHSCGADVFPIDIGMIETVEGLLFHKLMPGTDDIACGPAMPRETAIRAIETGAALVREKKAQGYRLVATGEVGMGNTTTASAVSAALLNLPAARVAGRGAGLSDDGLLRKQSAISRALEINKCDPTDPIDILCKVGGLDIAAMTGAFLGGAAFGIPVVMDGVISAAAALCAVRLRPAVREYILPSHISAEPAGQLLCDALSLSPILHADLRLGEGTGAVALFPLLDQAAAVYQQAATFDDIAISTYTKQC